MKIDPYRRKESFEKWLGAIESGNKIEGLSEKNQALLISFLKDMRLGLNVAGASKRGERSFQRLYSMKGKVLFVLRKLEERGMKSIQNLEAGELHKLFSEMRSGVISKREGTAYKATGDYVKDFKVFWHWHQKVMKKKGIFLQDITEDLDRRGEKPIFVYFTKEDFDTIVSLASYDLKPIIALAFDSGMRVTELVNIRVSDFSANYTELNIREETSKTFGRRIKLLLCPDQIRRYLATVGLQGDDYVCQHPPSTVNSELRAIGKKALSPEQIKYKNLTLYDFRHSSACFWLPRYKSEMAMKYRFGWKKSEMIHYYTEFLGMRDTITKDDLYVDISKTELEKEIDRLKSDLEKMKDAVQQLVNAASEKRIVV